MALMVLEHQVGMINRLTEAERYFQNSFRVSRSLYPDLEEATTLAELTGTPLLGSYQLCRKDCRLHALSR